jgi:hypothetical protein
LAIDDIASCLYPAGGYTIELALIIGVVFCWG